MEINETDQQPSEVSEVKKARTIIINELRLDIFRLGTSELHVSYIATFSLNFFDSPGLNNEVRVVEYRNRDATHLNSNPDCTTLRGVAFIMCLNQSMFHRIRGPASLQERNIEFIDLDTPRLRDKVSEDVILMFLLLPIEDTDFRGTRDTACDGLVDVDAFDVG